MSFPHSAIPAYLAPWGAGRSAVSALSSRGCRQIEGGDADSTLRAGLASDAWGDRIGRITEQSDGKGSAPMRKSVLVVAVLMVVMIVSSAMSNPGASASGRGVLSVLRVGQTVVIKDIGDKFEIEISARKLVSNYKVVEVGRDYLVLSNKPKLLELRIPLSSVKRVMHLKR